MNEQNPSPWLFPHPLAWLALTGFVLATGLGIFFTGFKFYASDLNTAFMGMFSLFLIAIWCSYRQILPLVQYVAFSILFFVILGMVLLMVSYMGIAAGMDLVDEQLAMIDMALGFDWPTHARWINDNPVLMETLVVTYNLIDKILAFTFLVLFALQKYDRVRELLILFLITSVATISIGIMLPAIGTYSYYNLPADQIANLPAEAGRYYLEHFNALRDGSMTSLALNENIGLITFPSFHTVLALLTAWVLRGTVAFWPMVLISLITLVSTLTQGGHHLIDVIAAIVLTSVVIGVYHRWIAAALARKDVMAYQNKATGLTTQSGLPQWLHNMIATLTRTRPTTNP